jgi:hypothetical protein
MPRISQFFGISHKESQGSRRFDKSLSHEDRVELSLLCGARLYPWLELEPASHIEMAFHEWDSYHRSKFRGY